MPRFVARPVVVEAHQFLGASLTFAMPDAFRRAVVRFLPDGQGVVATGEGERSCVYGDWIMRGPDGSFSVVRAATFEAMFAQQAPPEGEQPERTKRPYTRRVHVDG